MSAPERRAWVNPTTGLPSCPECGGYGYHEDGSDEGRECGTCHGDGVAYVVPEQEAAS